jgi:hypothetical protein
MTAVDDRLKLASVLGRRDFAYLDMDAVCVCAVFRPKAWRKPVQDKRSAALGSFSPFPEHPERVQEITRPPARWTPR